MAIRAQLNLFKTHSGAVWNRKYLFLCIPGKLQKNIMRSLEIDAFSAVQRIDLTNTI